MNDAHILYALDQDPRISLTSLARRLRMNRSTLEYRIAKMSERHVRNFYSIINGFNLGYMYFKLFITAKKYDTAPAMSLEKEEWCVWVARTDGPYDLVLTIRLRTHKDLERVLETIANSIAIKELHLTSISFGRVYSEDWLLNSTNRKTIHNSPGAETHATDALDEAILTLLVRNARMPHLQIAQKLGVTSQSITNRVKKLQKANIILGYKARINYEAMGLEYYHILISVKNEEEKRRLLTFFESKNTVVASLVLRGLFDLQIEIVAKNLHEIGKIIDEAKSKFDTIERIDKFGILEESSIKLY